MNAALIAAFASGALFGAGLALSSMTDRQVVLGFLDLFGDWNPTLAFVMAGAVTVTGTAFRFVRHMPAPALGGKFRLPTSDAIDRRLLAGAAVFGSAGVSVDSAPGPSW